MTTRLDELGRRQVLDVHQETRRKLRKGTSLVGQRDQYPADAKSARADCQHRSHRSTGRCKQPRVGPNLTLCRNPRNCLALRERRARNEYMPTQGIAGANGVNVRELTLVTLKYDAQKSGAAHRV